MTVRSELESWRNAASSAHKCESIWVAVCCERCVSVHDHRDIKFSSLRLLEAQHHRFAVALLKQVGFLRVADDDDIFVRASAVSRGDIRTRDDWQTENGVARVAVHR